MDSYVDDYYKRETYVKCYDLIINSLNGPDLLEHTNLDDVIPPPYRKSSHRLVKKRKRGLEIHKCSNCGVSGHKRERCSNPPLSVQPPKQSAVKKTNGGKKRSISQPAVQSATKGRKRSKLQGNSSSQPQPATSITPITRFKSSDSQPIPKPTTQASRPKTTPAATPQRRPKIKPIRSSTQPPPATKEKGTSSSSQPVMNKVSFSHNIALRVSPRKLRRMTKLPPRAWKKL